MVGRIWLKFVPNKFQLNREQKNSSEKIQCLLWLLKPQMNVPLYYSRVRCKLEQSAAVWSSSLTQNNIKDLERVKKSAVRIINGKSYESYTETLKELDMKRLSERRDLICLKFAKTSLRLDNFNKLFPMQKNIHDMETRQHERYHVVRSYGKRNTVSAIPSMQRLLNKEHKKQKEALKTLLSPTNYAM